MDDLNVNPPQPSDPNAPKPIMSDTPEAPKTPEAQTPAPTPPTPTPEPIKLFELKTLPTPTPAAKAPEMPATAAQTPSATPPKRTTPPPALDTLSLPTLPTSGIPVKKGLPKPVLAGIVMLVVAVTGVTAYIGINGLPFQGQVAQTPDMRSVAPVEKEEDVCSEGEYSEPLSERAGTTELNCQPIPKEDCDLLRLMVGRSSDYALSDETKTQVTSLAQTCTPKLTALPQCGDNEELDKENLCVCREGYFEKSEAAKECINCEMLGMTIKDLESKIEKLKMSEPDEAQKKQLKEYEDLLVVYKQSSEKNACAEPDKEEGGPLTQETEETEETVQIDKEKPGEAMPGEQEDTTILKIEEDKTGTEPTILAPAVPTTQESKEQEAAISPAIDFDKEQELALAPAVSPEPTVSPAVSPVNTAPTISPVVSPVNVSAPVINPVQISAPAEAEPDSVAPSLSVLTDPDAATSTSTMTTVMMDAQAQGDAAATTATTTTAAPATPATGTAPQNFQVTFNDAELKPSAPESSEIAQIPDYGTGAGAATIGAPTTTGTAGTTGATGTQTPPAISSTGPEIYFYLIGFAVAQLYLFRRRVFARS